jgi:hypothetical protein
MNQRGGWKTESLNGEGSVQDVAGMWATPAEAAVCAESSGRHAHSSRARRDAGVGASGTIGALEHPGPEHGIGRRFGVGGSASARS